MKKGVGQSDMVVFVPFSNAVRWMSKIKWMLPIVQCNQYFTFRNTKLIHKLSTNAQLDTLSLFKQLSNALFC